VCFGCGQPSDDHPSDSEEADGVYTFNCTTCPGSIVDGKMKAAGRAFWVWSSLAGTCEEARRPSL